MADRTLVKTKTPGIYSRGHRYVVVYRDPQGQQRKRFAETLGEAKRLKASLTTDVARGEFRELSRIRFDAYADDWIATYQGRTARGFREQTRSDYRDALDRDAKRFFGQRRLVEVEPRDVKRFVSWLAERGLAPASVRKSLAPVRALFATAVEEGLIRSNPAAGVRVAQQASQEADEVRVKALSEDELRALLEEVPDGSRLFVEFLAHTGLRISEAVALQWRHVEFGRRRLQVRRRFYRGSFAPPKSRFGRRDVPLSERMAQALWQLRKEGRGDDEELVFTSAGGTMIDPRNLMGRMLKPAAVRAGLGRWVGKPARPESWVGFHTLRHTCATTLFLAGLNAKQVQVWLGHHSPAFTLETYVHLLADDLPDPSFLDAVTAPNGGNTGATGAPETTRDSVTQLPARKRHSTTETPDRPKQLESALGHS